MEPKYKVVYQSILNDIVNHKYETKLPTEEELINTYNVSRNTVRKAIDVLTKQGYILPIQGSGMFLRDFDHSGYINLEQFKGLSSNTSSVLTTAVLKVELIEHDEKIAAAMKCSPDTKFYHVCRLRLLDGEPFVLEYSYFNKTLIPYLNEELAQKSIYSYIQNDLGLEIGFVDRLISAEKLSKEHAEILKLEENDPTLVSTNKALLKNGEIIDYSINYHNYKTTKFLKLSNFN